MVTSINRSRSEFHDLVITRMDAPGNPNYAIPKRVMLIRPNPLDESNDLLFIDQVPVPRDAWTYDAHDKTLRWQGLFGGGQLHLYASGRGAVGVIGGADRAISVRAGARAQFICSVALNSGATYESQNNAIVGFTWDTSSPAWKSATWVQDRLLLTYTVTQGSSIEPPTFTWEFEDKQTESIPWEPSLGSFEASLSLGQQQGLMVWNLVFKSNVPPDQDIGLSSPEPDTVYPYWMQAREDAAASTINGVLQIDDLAPKGTLVGMQGKRVASMVAGYYHVSPDKAPFAVFDGRLHLNGKPVADSYMLGNTLYWRGLDRKHQKRLGLPAEGKLLFSKNGSLANDPHNTLTVRRLSANSTHNQIAKHCDLHPKIHDILLSQVASLADTSPNIYGLLAMTPFAQNTQGEWGDVVQSAVRQNLSEIMNSYISEDIWKLLFPNVNQPILSGELAEIANSPVSGIGDPTAWYKTLGTAVMTQGLANGSDSNTKNLNGPRAAAWLKQEVANSKVYQVHGQKLFQYQWGQRFPQTADYISDQITNAATYEATIDSQIKSSINDINTNVVADGSSPDLKQNLIKEVQAVGEYAKTNKLFWAFAYYTYNTAPAILANIAIQIGINTGSSDGTTLTRLFQQNITVLTALDPSGYFAQQYNKTINIFLATNILPSMYGFTGDAESFELIKEYLQTFVQQNIANEDQQIADAATQIKNILDEKDADEILKASIETLRTFAEAIQDTLALPYIANRWVNWFSSTFPRFSKIANIFGSVFIGGITGLAIFNLFSTYKSWDKLTAGEKAEVILDTVQLGLQILAAVVKRGVRLYAIFQVDGMSFWQRSAAVNRILVEGEASRLDEGLVNISNRTARWLGDTAGSIEMRDEITLLLNIGDNDLEEVSWTIRIFGRNLDEFIATRVGPILILAGIGLSIYFITTGETGVALGADIVNIVGGVLTLFALVGTWAVEGGLIVADGVLAGIIAFAGPLAIIAALVGVALVLYELFQKPPDPVKEFVDQYAKPAGFYVDSKASSIDYVIPYAAKEQNNLLMLGFTLSPDIFIDGIIFIPSGKIMIANADGSLSLGSATSLPDTVWQSQTDGLGMSQIFTLIEKDKTEGPIGVLLSLMSDYTVSFQPRMSSSQTKSQAASGKPTILTQTWLSHPQTHAVTTNDDTDLVSLDLKFQPVMPDQNGNYHPSQAGGWLITTTSGVGYSANQGSLFNLKMSGLAPNFMTMSDISFILNSTPSQQQKFGPRFGINPSTPFTYSLTGGLPSFLSFSKETGTFSPNGQTANQAIKSNNSLTISNALGNESVNFTITVA
ncbi:putative Ig domain-containing protein [Gloeothece verrucosa]|uniref:Uncharacterized protein n=1 Tax=Gloeothece verrucosa (strain PCC 7822) TaxID=497965 RepID=E0UKK1_GLOV7|nr:putative Ig domain-containing protein [Gloeothece verrucosa]ADN17481.1 hypothetical protein Cyan7822_5614 [Gloeothece verrucosa PCC 7822]